MSWKWWIKPPAPERNIPAERLQLALRAKQTLPVMREAYAEIRAALVDQWAMSGPDDEVAREYFYHSVKGLDAVVAMVETYARHGDMVETMEAHKKKVNPNG